MPAALFCYEQFRNCRWKWLFPLLALVPSISAWSDPAQTSGAQAISFAAAGDIGANGRAAASLAALDASGVAFFLALGDMDYNETSSDAAWCDYVKQRLPVLGPAFPFQLVSGNHEEQGGEDGYILNHAACLPDRLGSTGTYAAEYYFDYPASAPLVRVIMIAADLTVGNVTYDYVLGNAHYSWLSAAIDSARAEGIPWVVVGMHKNCITAGIKPCEIGTQLFNLLVAKRVDLVFQGHDHNYQRGKQLAHGPACSSVPAGSYDADCVAGSGADGTYVKGAGTILVISGSFGRCCYGTSVGDSESGYFAKFDSTSSGFTKLDVSESRIDAQFVRSTGTLTDSFSIAGGADFDGDGFDDSAEAHVGTDPADSCGEQAGSGVSGSWPADLASGGVPDSTDRVTIADVTSFVAPARRLDTSPGAPGYSVRWDLMPGPGSLPPAINIQDLTQLIVLEPPMFGGQRAFDGPVCTG